MPSSLWVWLVSFTSTLNIVGKFRNVPFRTQFSIQNHALKKIWLVIITWSWNQAASFPGSVKNCIFVGFFWSPWSTAQYKLRLRVHQQTNTFQSREGMGWRSPWSGALSRALLAPASGTGTSSHQELAPASTGARQTQQWTDAYVQEDARLC